MSKFINKDVFQGYAIEFIGTAAAYGLIRVVWNGKQVTDFVHATCDEWNDLTGILFSAALAVWLTFINIRGSLFGDYLAREQGDAVFSRAFLTAMIGFFLATASMIVTRGIKSDYMAHAAMLLLIYSGFNLVSMMSNATDLIKLYSEFKRVLEIEKAKLDRQAAGQSTNVPQ